MHFKKTRGFLLCLVLAMAATTLQGCGTTKKALQTLEQIQAMKNGGEVEEDTEEDTVEDTMEDTEDVEIESDEETSEAEEEEAASSGVEMPDTLRWCSAAYAILTEINGRDYTTFETIPITEKTQKLQQQALEEWWGVTDRESADENLEWVLTEGHRTSFQEDMQYLEECGIGEVASDKRAEFVYDNFDVTIEDASFYESAYNMYEEYGANAIDAWDYCRALNLTNFYYIAGYYTEEEAKDKSLEIALELQPLYSSWDELVDSYLRGYEYWAEESSDERRAIYEELQSRSDNPYAIPYDTVLEKTW